MPVDLQQNAGESLRKISALAYTINTSQNRNGKAGSSSSKIVIEDTGKRFIFINASSIPHPRRFGENGDHTKLYPSGRGSSVPLDLSLYS